MLNQVKLALFLFALYLTLFPDRSYAYLDPGTGSYILQIAAAVFFAGIFVVKTWWTHIKNLILKIFKRKGKESEESPKDAGKSKD